MGWAEVRFPLVKRILATRTDAYLHIFYATDYRIHQPAVRSQTFQSLESLENKVQLRYIFGHKYVFLMDGQLDQASFHFQRCATN